VHCPKDLVGVLMLAPLGVKELKYEIKNWVYLGLLLFARDKILDPFAGGGAIPLEAMRLGCEVTAIDINPVAWFILKCTLEYPQKLAGQKLPLPDFVLKDRDFMESFFKLKGLKGASLKRELEKLGLDKDDDWIPGLNVEEGATLEANLAWHVRAWGWWVLQQARRDLATFYPTYANFEPIKESDIKCEKREIKRVPLLENGNLDLNDQLSFYEKL
jgi:putative DNA methylase